MFNLKDRLSHLTYTQACKLLGPEGGKLIRKGGKYDINIEDQVILNRDIFKLDLGEAVVTIKPDDMKGFKSTFSLSSVSGLRSIFRI